MIRFLFLPTMWRKKFKINALLPVRLIFISLLLFSLLFSGFPGQSIINSLEFFESQDKASFDPDIAKLFGVNVSEAGNFSVRTGYYVGDGGTKAITGLGFNPQLVIVKADDNAGTGAIMKTNVMPALNTAYLGVATADYTSGAIALVEDGFEVATSLSNTSNSRYTWIAFAGSDCSASGNFCIGSYTGNATSPRAINTGFQPDMVLLKAATAVASNWRSSVMADNYGQYLMATNQDTTGALFTTLDSAGFTVGASNNTNAVVYYYVAFKNTAGALTVGSYSGTGVAQDISGLGFQPDFVFTKNANAATAVGAVYNTYSSYGNSSSYFTDTANVVGAITGLINDGFSVGTNGTANGSGNTIYYAAFNGNYENNINASGTFQSISGSYVGTGVLTAINNLGFEPDLVIIKGDTNQPGIFRTRMMGGDITAFLDSASTHITGAITSLNASGFTVATHPAANSLGVTYYWTAYGNAWRPEKNSGAADFYIGAYYGNGTDNRNITGLPFAADMVMMKRNSTTAGTFRTSEHSGDLGSFFLATADATNTVQVLNSDGFQIGSSANVNAAAGLYNYFGFKNGPNFKVGTYSGSGAAKDVDIGWPPDTLWIKQTGAVRGVNRNSSMSGNGALPFLNAGLISNAITGFTASGFSLGTAAETNTSGTNNYRYVAWRNTNSLVTPSFKLRTGYYVGDGGAKYITGLGFSPQLVVIKADDVGGTGAIMKSNVMPVLNAAYLGVATADSTAAPISLSANGFEVAGTLTDASNSRYTWIAFAGSDCSASGNLCIGSYTGNGTSSRAINTGFQPNLVLVKGATAVAANWCSSAMPDNYGQYFMATTQDTSGALFRTLDGTGFTVGTSNNTNAVVYYYIAFKNTPGSIATGAHTGSGAAKNVTGLGFKPDFVFTKNANATTAVGAVYNTYTSYGDYSSYFTDTANVVGAITGLISDGFSVGTNATANCSGNNLYYAAFNGDYENDINASGSFQIARGSYVGTGVLTAINNLGFEPDLVMIKGDTAQAGIFRTRMMGGDNSAYLDAATANLTGAITSLNAAGFTVGTSATANSAGVTYYWTAYGNAWRPEKNDGASDFYIGTYYGNGTDNHNITGLPFAADLVVAKRNSATAGTFRTSAHSGDSSSFFLATADAANSIQALNSDGFQIGTSTYVNLAAGVYNYFGFKNGSNFKVGTYSGSGVAQDVDIGWQPDNLWIKQTGAVRGVNRNSSMSGNGALPFLNVGLISNAIVDFISNGFSLGTAAETNTSGTNNYRYVAWRLPDNGVLNATFSGSMNTSAGIPSAAAYVGGALILSRSEGTESIASIKLSETGTVNADTYLSDLTLKYDTDSPCAYDGNEATFGTAASFSGQAAVVSGNLNIGTTPVCFYPLVSVNLGTPGGETLAWSLNAANDVVTSSSNLNGSFPMGPSGSTTLSSGSLSVDIVDDNGDPVSTPSLAFSPLSFSFTPQTATGTLGVIDQKIRVSNNSGNEQWNLSIAADNSTSLWSGGGAYYDYNDDSAGATDGADADIYGGQLSLDPNFLVITPQSSCSDTGLVVGDAAAFVEGSLDSLTLVEANSSAATGCYWDISGINVSQTVPAEQATNLYSLPMSLTITAI